MDTKSKNIRYRLGMKIFASIMVWICLMGSLGSGLFLLYNAEKIRSESYYDTNSFQGKMSRLVHNLVELNTTLKEIDEIEDKEEINITEESVNTERVTEKTETETVKTSEIVETTEATEVTEVQEVQEGVKEKDIESEAISETENSEKLIRVATINNNLSRAVNFNYYIRDIKTGEVSSKTAHGYNPELIKEDPSHIYIAKNNVPYYFDYYNDIQNMLANSPHEIYILMNDPLIPGDEFYDDFAAYTRVKELIPYAMGTLVSTLILLLFSFGYLIVVSGRQEKDGEITLIAVDKVSNDVQSLFLLIAAIASVGMVNGVSYRLDSKEYIFIAVLLGLDIVIGMTYFFSMLRQFKKGVLLKNTLVWKFMSGSINFVRSCFNQKIFKAWMIGVMLGYALINGILFGSFLMIVFNAVAVYFAFKALKSLALIMDAAKEISNGNLDYSIDQSQISMVFLSFAQDIQSVQVGLKNAVNEAIKGERMKTDLITNVSHDLKTPLTSIINYVDLLKQEEINNEKATGYLEILDEKSDRLKQLIEDLIEASKASSGNITITTEEVDLHELIIQACGEYEEKIEKANLDIRLTAPEEKTVVLADGKYMWRIVENMMSNILKYSMAGSRVYISIEESNGYGLLTMKNMSAYPLDIDPAQLTERFIRADESRTTEGSGLGLSIAQSLTSIQGGKFSIEIDGDLFKVMVEMPLIKIN